MNLNDRRAVLLILGFVMAMGYRPGHPWAGIATALLMVIIAAAITAGRR